MALFLFAPSIFLAFSGQWPQALCLLAEAHGKNLANAIIFSSVLRSLSAWRRGSELLRCFGGSQLQGAGKPKCHRISQTQKSLRNIKKHG
jgi:hypothetical protein